MGKTKIEWATMVWSVVTGCTKVSQGCRNCWAKSLHDKRHKAYLAGKKMPKQYAQPFEVVQMHPDRLDEPLHWRKPQRIFVASGGDLFHPDVPDSFIMAVWRTMISASQHTFIILTKRLDRMRSFCNRIWVSMVVPRIYSLDDPMGYPPINPFILKNVWLGVSVENQATADERIPLLLQTPAAIRFVSVEPMLEGIDLSAYIGLNKSEWTADELLTTNFLDWTICGGESGPGARPHPSRKEVEDLMAQCYSAGVPFFLKQMWDEKMPVLDGRIWDQYPEVKR